MGDKDPTTFFEEEKAFFMRKAREVGTKVALAFNGKFEAVGDQITYINEDGADEKKNTHKFDLYRIYVYFDIMTIAVEFRVVVANRQGGELDRWVLQNVKMETKNIWNVM